MKIPVKYIMVPLLLGGFIISLCFTIYAYRKCKPIHDGSPSYKQHMAARVLKQETSVFCFRILQKLSAH
jgi:hypothetical protein